MNTEEIIKFALTRPEIVWHWSALLMRNPKKRKK